MINYNDNLSFKSFKQINFPLGIKAKRVPTTETQNIQAITELFKRDLKSHKVSYGYVDYGKNGGIKEIFSAIKGKFRLSMSLEPGKGNQTLDPLGWDYCGITIIDRFTTHHIQQKDIDKNPGLQKVINKFMKHVYEVFPDLTKK